MRVTRRKCEDYSRVEAQQVVPIQAGAEGQGIVYPNEANNSPRKLEKLANSFSV